MSWNKPQSMEDGSGEHAEEQDKEVEIVVNVPQELQRSP
jgi:hypothetical protein